MGQLIKDVRNLTWCIIGIFIFLCLFSMKINDVKKNYTELHAKVHQLERQQAVVMDGLDKAEELLDEILLLLNAQIKEPY